MNEPLLSITHVEITIILLYVLSDACFQYTMECIQLEYSQYLIIIRKINDIYISTHFYY